MTPSATRMRQGGRLIGLFVFLVSIYMIVYSARIESGDTRLIFDATSSFVDHGDFLIDLAAYFRPPRVFSELTPLPLHSVDTEPLQILLAAPLYLLAKIVPGFGMVQTVWLFNPIVIALTACALYLYALQLGWHERTALVGALVLGMMTVMFPYARTFFREPLAGLFLLVTALSIDKLRGSGYRSRLWWGAAALALLCMILTKASTLMALPALIIIGLPSLRAINHRIVIAVALVTAAIVGLILLLTVFSIGGERYNILDRLIGVQPQYFGTALRAYLISPGASFWGTSPVLLLAIPSVWALIRRREGRYPLALVMLTLVFAFGYAYTSSAQWYGGLSLPPRFLVPIIPMWIIAVLPVLDRLRARRTTVLIVMVALAMLASIWVQLSAITVDLSTYPAHLPPESHGLIEWAGGLYDLRWMRWVVIPQLWGTIPVDFAWSNLNLPAWAAGFGLLALTSAALLIRKVTARRSALMLLGLLVVGIVIGLETLYAVDWRYGAGDTVAFNAIRTITTETHDGDILILSNPRYEEFFHNYGKWWGAARLITLPVQPGERPSPEQPAQVQSNDPVVLLDSYSIMLLRNLAATHDRLWVLENGSPDVWWSVRPVERFMSAFYHPIRSIQVGDFVRLIEYSTAPAPDPYGFVGADTVTDLRFGDSIRLLGVDVVGAGSLHAGAALPISLLWTTDSTLSIRYTAAVYLRDANGAPIAQNDYPPGDGFAETDTWIPGLPVWDNRALRLPAELPAGTYQLWIKVYRFAPDGTVADLPVSGTQVIDGNIGVLPITLTAAN